MTYFTLVNRPIIDLLNPLSANSTKWSYTLKQLVSCSGRTVWVCLTISWGWRLKGWIYLMKLWLIFLSTDKYVLSKALQATLNILVTPLVKLSQYHVPPDIQETNHIQSSPHFIGWIEPRDFEANPANSKWSNISAGDPQGSVLGLLLFFIYINNLFDSMFLSCHVRVSEWIQTL